MCQSGDGIGRRGALAGFAACCTACRAASRSSWIVWALGGGTLAPHIGTRWLMPALGCGTAPRVTTAPTARRASRLRSSDEPGGRGDGGVVSGWASGAPAQCAGGASATIDACPGRCTAVLLPVPDDSGTQPRCRPCLRRLRRGTLLSADPHRCTGFGWPRKPAMTSSYGPGLGGRDHEGDTEC